MNYNLAFLPSALKEWRKLDPTVREWFKTKLTERMGLPHVPGDRLRGHPRHYKIKLQSSGYRLVYEVEEEVKQLLVITVGHRDKGKIYQVWKKRKG
ncbi:MAG: type II toxin-antitoxin system RelE/ParE family toxin [Deltaproteobacteria bacterium]|nr:type II toxin-antitoxin system RelE/ParE family toxin [Deltaproteobacteria bacterium]